jgi:predicted dehydrogenase
MRWGLLSTARINRALLAGAAATDAAEVVAVASRDAERGAKFAAQHGIPRCHSSYEALLADPEVDAVYVPLPNSLHLPWSITALEAGKHVLCEKPLSRRVADVEAAFDVADSAGLVLAEAFMWRHHPQVARLRELLDSGAIGRLRLFRSVFSFPIASQDDIRLSAALDGGSLMDVGCYCVSASRLVAGAEPERVHGEQVLGGDGVDIAFSGTLRFGGDVLAQFDCGFALPLRMEVEAVGEAGSLRLTDPWKGTHPAIELRNADGHLDRRECERANPYACELEDFARAAAGEKPHPFGRADAVGQARVIEALYESAEAGTGVTA